MKAKMLFDEAQSQPIRNYFMSNEISLSLCDKTETKQPTKSITHSNTTKHRLDLSVEGSFYRFLSYNVSD